MDIIKKAMIEAMKLSYGIISVAANKVEISRQTHYNWMKDDPEYKEEIESINEAAIDHVEGKLMERVNGVAIAGEDGSTYYQAPSDTAIIFYLKCKGKKRGYVERQEVVPMDPDGNAVQPIININVIRNKKEDDSL